MLASIVAWDQALYGIVELGLVAMRLLHATSLSLAMTWGMTGDVKEKPTRHMCARRTLCWSTVLAQAGRAAADVLEASSQGAAWAAFAMALRGQPTTAVEALALVGSTAVGHLALSYRGHAILRSMATLLCMHTWTHVTDMSRLASLPSLVVALRGASWIVQVVLCAFCWFEELLSTLIMPAERLATMVFGVAPPKLANLLLRPKYVLQQAASILKSLGRLVYRLAASELPTMLGAVYAHVCNIGSTPGTQPPDATPTQTRRVCFTPGKKVWRMRQGNTDFLAPPWERKPRQVALPLGTPIGPSTTSQPSKEVHRGDQRADLHADLKARGGGQDRSERRGQPREMETIYLERQVGQNCQVHAWNNMVGSQKLCYRQVLNFATSLDAAYVAGWGMTLAGYYTPGAGNYSVAMINAWLLNTKVRERSVQPTLSDRPALVQQLRMPAGGDLWGIDAMPQGAAPRLNTTQLPVATRQAVEGVINGATELQVHYETKSGWGHAVAMRKLEGQWYWLDSDDRTEPRPQPRPVADHEWPTLTAGEFKVYIPVSVPCSQAMDRTPEPLKLALQAYWRQQRVDYGHVVAQDLTNDTQQGDHTVGQDPAPGAAPPASPTPNNGMAPLAPAAAPEARPGMVTEAATTAPTPLAGLQPGDQAATTLAPTQPQTAPSNPGPTHEAAPAPRKATRQLKLVCGPIPQVAAVKRRKNQKLTAPKLGMDITRFLQKQGQLENNAPPTPPPSPPPAVAQEGPPPRQLDPHAPHADPEAQHKSLTVWTSNVKGLAQNVQDLSIGLTTHKPDIVVLTETQLKRSSRAQGVHVGAIKRALRGYRCHASATGACDGVLVAVRHSLAKWGQLGVRPCQPEAQGRLLHVVLSLPHSPPLHIMGAYMPPGSDASALAQRAGIEGAVRSAIAEASREGAHCLVAGDFNATLQPQDRSSGRVYMADAQHAEFVARCQLQPLEPCAEGGRPPTFVSDELTPDQASTSRIDDILTTCEATARDPCTQVRVLSPTATSDHRPLLATVPAASMSLVLPPEEEHQDEAKGESPPVLVRPVSNADQARFRNAVGTGRLAQRTADLWGTVSQLYEEHMVPHMRGKEAVCGRTVLTLELIAGRPAREVVTQVCSQLVELLAECLETALSVCATKPQGPSKHMQARGVGRKRRAMANQFKAVVELLHKCSGEGEDCPASALADLAPNDSHAAAVASRLASNAAPAHQALKEEGKRLRAAMKEMDAAHRLACKEADVRAQRRLWQRRPKRAHQQIFGKAQEPQGALDALMDGNSVTMDPARLLAIAHDYYSKLLAAPKPKAPSLTAILAESAREQKVWQRDGMRLETRATRLPCRPWLHTAIADEKEFYACMRSLACGKAVGLDGVPTELLRMLPDTLKQTTHRIFLLMWLTGVVPDSWKESETCLLYKGKGSQLHLKFYRPITLEKALYKAFTALATRVVSDYAEEHGIMCEGQAGGRRFRSTTQVVDMLTMACEDARAYKKDLYILMIDFTAAFNTIDQDDMLAIMFDLGFPCDSLAVVHAMYTGATTVVAMPAGRTAPIPVQRGTLQGNIMSPLLFNLYMTPLVRWLQFGALGYRFGCLTADSPPLAARAFLDDLTALTSSVSAVHQQAEKVTVYGNRYHIETNAEKSVVTAALHARASGSRALCTAAKNTLVHAHNAAAQGAANRAAGRPGAPLKSTIELQGRKVTFVPPTSPFKLLGVYMTATLDWSHARHEMVKLLAEKLRSLSECFLTPTQKLRVLETNVRPALAFHMGITPCTPVFLQRLDGMAGRFVRKTLGLAHAVPTAMLREELVNFGMGCPSLATEYGAASAKGLLDGLQDGALRGDVSRALLATQLECLAGLDPHTCGNELNYCLRARQLSVLHQSDLRLWHQEEEQFAPAVSELWAKSEELRSHLSAIPSLHRLLRLPGVTDLRQLLNAPGTHVLSARQLELITGRALPKSARTSLARLTRALCGGDATHNTDESGQRDLAPALRRVLPQWRAHVGAPTYAAGAPHEGRHQKTIEQCVAMLTAMTAGPPTAHRTEGSRSRPATAAQEEAFVEGGAGAEVGGSENTLPPTQPLEATENASTTEGNPPVRRDGQQAMEVDAPPAHAGSSQRERHLPPTQSHGGAGVHTADGAQPAEHAGQAMEVDGDGTRGAHESDPAGTGGARAGGAKRRRVDRHRQHHVAKPPKDKQDETRHRVDLVTLHTPPRAPVTAEALARSATREALATRLEARLLGALPKKDRVRAAARQTVAVQVASALYDRNLTVAAVHAMKMVRPPAKGRSDAAPRPSQTQMLVEWRPTLIDAWARPLMDRAGWVVSSAEPVDRAALHADATHPLRPQVHCELCCGGHGGPEGLRWCDGCHKCYHMTCLGRAEEAGLAAEMGWLCPVCSDPGPCPTTPVDGGLLLVEWGREWHPLGEGVEHPAACFDSPEGREALRVWSAARESPAAAPRAAEDAKLPNMTRQQPEDKPGTWKTTRGSSLRGKVRLLPAPINPQADIHPPGRHTIVIREVDTWQGEQQPHGRHTLACVYEPDGRLAGTLGVDQLATLKRRFDETANRGGHAGITPAVGPFEREVAELICRYRDGHKFKASDTGKPHEVAWAASPSAPRLLLEGLIQCLGITKERFASPLDVHHAIDHYNSVHARDAVFGADPGAYASIWTGWSWCHPPRTAEAIDKAVAWAVASARAAQDHSLPSASLLMVPNPGGAPAYIQRLGLGADVATHLGTIAGRSGLNASPGMRLLPAGWWAGGPAHRLENAEDDVDLVLVWNAAARSSMRDHAAAVAAAVGGLGPPGLQAAPPDGAGLERWLGCLLMDTVRTAVGDMNGLRREYDTVGGPSQGVTTLLTLPSPLQHDDELQLGSRAVRSWLPTMALLGEGAPPPLSCVYGGEHWGLQGWTTGWAPPQPQHSGEGQFPKRFGKARASPETRHWGDDMPRAPVTGWLGARDSLRPHVGAAMQTWGSAAHAERHPLRWDWRNMAYTDGSHIQQARRGDTAASLLGAAVYVPALGERAARTCLVDPGGEGPSWTISRAELAAIWVALTMGLTTICTDSLASIWLIQAAVCDPMRLRRHKHRPLLEAIVAQIEAADGPVTIAKVAAHQDLGAMGAIGNNEADDAAKRAAKAPDACDRKCTITPHGFADQMWIGERRTPEKHGSGPGEIEYVNDLRSGLTKRMRAVHRLGSADPDKSLYASLWRKVARAALPTVSNAFASDAAVTHAQRRTVWAYRTGTLFNKKLEQRWFKTGDGLCPLCKQPDGGGHIAGGCLDARMRGMYTDRHNAVARILLKAVAKSDTRGAELCGADVGSADDMRAAGLGHLCAHRNVWPALLPAACARAPSRPDAWMVRQGAQAGLGWIRTRGSSWSPSNSEGASVTLIEIKMCPDTDPTQQRQRAEDQHADMEALLRERLGARGTVVRRTILVGHSGTVYDEHSLKTLMKLGVTRAAALKALGKAHRTACQYLHSIVGVRRHLEPPRARRPP